MIKIVGAMQKIDNNRKNRWVGKEPSFSLGLYFKELLDCMTFFYPLFAVIGVGYKVKIVHSLFLQSLR
jgi:hypothetical protein